MARRSASARFLIAAWILLGVGVLTLAVWLVWLFVGTNQLGRNEAQLLVAEFKQSCTAAESIDAQTDVIATIDLGDGMIWPIRAGVDDDVLEHSLGWYPHTAEPGKSGNTVVTGYRATNGSPLAAVSELAPGDQITVATCEAELKYEVVVGAGELTVAEDATWILDAVPGHPGETPRASMLTLVTSQDLLPSSDREVIFAKLVS